MRRLQELGISPSETELKAACENSYCPPDIIGINHYLTSDRFLDEHLENYPAWTHGGNGWDKYADVETMRVRAESVAGVYTLLQYAHQQKYFGVMGFDVLEDLVL